MLFALLQDYGSVGFVEEEVCYPNDDERDYGHDPEHPALLKL